MVKLSLFSGEKTHQTVVDKNSYDSSQNIRKGLHFKSSQIFKINGPSQIDVMYLKNAKKIIFKTIVVNKV